MNLLIFGINHNTAPVELREKVAFGPEQLTAALIEVAARANLTEVAILSTCNRTEIIAVNESGESGEICDWLASYHKLPASALAGSVYTKTDQDAVLHAARVAAGLDSMVIGESQILGQFKTAFDHATRSGTMGPELNHLSQTSFRIAKRVRTETAIGESSVSIAATAVTLARQLFSNLEDRQVLLIGAGDTCTLVGKHLVAAGMHKFTIANRTLDNANRLAALIAGKAIDLQGIPEALLSADLVISATSAPLPILGKGVVERTLRSRKHRPILMVDLSVPRDIEPEVNELRDIYLYCIDDLTEIIDSNLSSRQEAATHAEAILNIELSSFRSRKQSNAENQTLLQFRALHDSIRKTELEKALARLRKGEDPEKVLDMFANQLTNKIIHTPSTQIKNAVDIGQSSLIEAINELYQLSSDIKRE